MTEQDFAYYKRRAEAELELAGAATLPTAIALHYELAMAYVGKLTERSREALGQKFGVGSG